MTFLPFVFTLSDFIFTLTWNFADEKAIIAL